MQETNERSAAVRDAPSRAYPTLLVHVEPGSASTDRVKAASRLARDTGARLIGVGAEGFEPLTAADPYLGASTAEWIDAVRTRIADDLMAAEAAFRRDAAGADLEWRVVEDYPSRALRKLARAADLIVVGPKTSASAARCADPGEIVMEAGRPVLLTPTDAHLLRGRSVVVAWKDARECRRAISDAMPFLTRAEDVVVLGVAPPGEEDRVASEIDDVLANLARRDVKARPLVASAEDRNVVQELDQIATEHDADLIVAGAYGHGRLREWAFGGVTDDLLRRPRRFVLMSH